MLNAEDFVKNQKLINGLKKFNPKIEIDGTITNSRNIYNPEFDFSVDTDIAKYIELGTYHSYTFPISRTEENGLTENLLLSVQDDGTYLACLVSYDVSEEEKEQLKNGMEIDLTGKISYTFLEDQDWTNSNFSNRTEITSNGADCVDVDTYTVNQCEDADGNTLNDNGDLGNGCVRNWT